MLNRNKTASMPNVSMFKVLRCGLQMKFKNMPVSFILLNVFAVMLGLLRGFTTFVMHHFYDSVENVIVGDGALSLVYLMLTAVGLTFVAIVVFDGAFTYLFEVVHNKSRGYFSLGIHEKMERIDPEALEDIRFHDDLAKAVAGSYTGVSNVVNNGLMIVTFSIPYFIFMGIYLHHLNPMFILAIVLVFVPVFIGQFIRTGIMTKFEDETAPINRELDFYTEAIINSRFFKETRILGAFPFFFKNMIAAVDKLGNVEWNAAKKRNLLELFMSLLSAAGYAGIVLMLVFSLLAGEISAGAFAAVFTSIGIMFNMMETMIMQNIGSMAHFMGRASNYVRFMDMSERHGASATPMPEAGIAARNVSFTYPGASKKSVDDVTLSIRPGETIAIVGENGAGKSTLVRLLLGLYLPQEGTVHLNGMDTKVTNIKSLFENISGVFQRYWRYQMTLKENVQISDHTSNASIGLALKQANVDIAGPNFPDGEDTMFGREFGGRELSGGEWQRIAIARGIYRAHNIIVLDEPTAAIDPLEESRIYNQFVEISAGKTAIIVTHRLGSTKIADRVVVMNNGRVVDIGRHDELMQREGLYAEMFNSQAGWY